MEAAPVSISDATGRDSMRSRGLPARKPQLRPATRPRADESETKLLVIDPHVGSFHDTKIDRLVDHLRPFDLLVLNDAATLPASLPARTARGAFVEVRLLEAPHAGRLVRVVLLGEGDHRTPTEHRPAPPRLVAGDELRFGHGLSARVAAIGIRSERQVDLLFDLDEAALINAIYAIGRPIQYAHVPLPLDLWSVQNSYASRPWAVENPSAGRPLRAETFRALRARGIELATLTHAAGLSSSGDAAIDDALPFPERYSIPTSTVEALARARARGGRVVAVGTSVVRALEGCAEAHGGRVVAEEAITDLRIDARFRLRIVDGLLTGMHEPDTSHFDLMRAFASPALLQRAHLHAVERGYLGHELGDVALILAA